MSQEISAEKTFLSELYRAVGSDTSAQAAMQDIGRSIGLEEDEAGQIAQDLCIKGLAELKTLSGGIGITVQGLEALNITPPPGSGTASGPSLGSAPILDTDRADGVVEMLATIKKEMADIKSPYDAVETLVIDIKTIEVQMLSPEPKTKIIKEGFCSLLQTIQTHGPKGLAQRIEAYLA